MLASTGRRDDNPGLTFGDGDITRPHPGYEIAGDGRRDGASIIAQICGADESGDSIVEGILRGDGDAERHTSSLWARDGCEGEVIQSARINSKGIRLPRLSGTARRDDNAGLTFGNGDISRPYASGEIAGDGRRDGAGIVAQISGADESGDGIVEGILRGDRDAERHTGSLIADR